MRSLAKGAAHHSQSQLIEDLNPQSKQSHIQSFITQKEKQRELDRVDSARMKRKIRELNSHIKYKNLQNTYKIKLSATPERMLCRDLPLSSVQEAVGPSTTNLTIESLPSRSRETGLDFVVRATQLGPKLQGEVC